jgi:hypothetical protein
MDKNPKGLFQMIWGIALLFAGASVFLRIPYVMPEIESIKYFSTCTSYLKFCFYFVGIFLIGGGLKKIFKHYKR